MSDCNDCVTLNACEKCSDAYLQGRADERAEILKMVDWRVDQDIARRKIDIHIDFAEILTTENVLRIIEEQLKEQEK